MGVTHSRIALAQDDVEGAQAEVAGALELAETWGADAEICGAWLIMSEAARRSGDSTLALELAEDSEAKAADRGATRQVVQSLIAAGRALELSGDLSEAEERLMDALHVNGSIGNRRLRRTILDALESVARH